MPNWQSFKKEIVLLGAGLILVLFALYVNFNPTVTEALKSEQPSPTPTPTPDPGKDLKSLDNYLDFTLPIDWKKTDYLDIKYGKDTIIKLTTMNFEASQSAVINGAGIVIDRTYDLNAEESLKNKLNTPYGFDTYNVMPIKIDGKNSMTMHQDKDGHHRFIFIATRTHLWEISIVSKSLEDEAKHQGDIETFLNSIKFKN